jgi:ribosome-associated toxin RatA of RatAB toxin-antitoxin module
MTGPLAIGGARGHSAIAIDVAAPPDLVFRLARDPLRWPALLPHYSRARLIERLPDGMIVAQFVARRPLGGPFAHLGWGIPVAWRSRAWAEPGERRLRFVHQGGATDGMDVTWRIEGDDRGCRVTIDHAFEGPPSLYQALVQRVFVRAIAGRTLATFKAIAEAVDDGGQARDA